MSYDVEFSLSQKSCLPAVQYPFPNVIMHYMGHILKKSESLGCMCVIEVKLNE